MKEDCEIAQLKVQLVVIRGIRKRRNMKERSCDREKERVRERPNLSLNSRLSWITKCDRNDVYVTYTMATCNSIAIYSNLYTATRDIRVFITWPKIV